MGGKGGGRGGGEGGWEVMRKATMATLSWGYLSFHLMSSLRSLSLWVEV